MPAGRKDIYKDAKPFPKGKSGNPNGRPKKLPELEEAIAEELNREYQINGATHTGLSAMMRTAVNKAIKGDVRWFEAIMKYAYKTAGQTDVGLNSGTIRVQFVEDSQAEPEPSEDDED
jgi:hypothetical protein